MYTTVKILLKGKGGMVKISEDRKGGDNFIDAIERLSICNIDKPLHR